MPLNDSPFALEDCLLFDDFVVRYNAFCMEKDLNPMNSRKEIKLLLLKSYGMRTERLTIKRVTGCKWKDGYSRTGSLSPFGDEHMHAEGSFDSVESALNALIEVSNNHDDFIALRSASLRIRRTDERFQLLGLTEVIEKQIQEGVKANVEDEIWNFFSSKDHRIESYTIEIIPALQMLKFSEGEKAKLSIQHIGRQAVIVLIHLLLYLFIPVFFTSLMLSYTTLVSETTRTGWDPVTWLDLISSVLGSWSFEVLSVLPYHLRVAGKACASSALVVFCFQLISYLEVAITAKTQKMNVTVKVLSAIYFSICVLSVFCFIALVALWIMLAVFLKPSKYLPLATALVVTFGVVIYQANRFEKIWKKFKVSTLFPFDIIFKRLT